MIYDLTFKCACLLHLCHGYISAGEGVEFVHYEIDLMQRMSQIGFTLKKTFAMCILRYANRAPT